jgi:hypothetical protein
MKSIGFYEPTKPVWTSFADFCENQPIFIDINTCWGGLEPRIPRATGYTPKNLNTTQLPQAA